MTLEMVPWRGSNVPLLSRSSFPLDMFAQQIIDSGRYMGPPMPVLTYGNRPAEPISYSFEGFVRGMLYTDGPVASAELYRLRVFGQAPLLYQELVDGRAGDMFDDDALDRLRSPWPAGTLADLMKRSLVYGDFGGNAFILDLEDELVLVRPDWVEIVLEKREYRGGQVGWKQKGILYYEGGLSVGEGVPFLPGEYAHFVPGLPDPLATYRGMSWLTPLVREVQADKSAADHKALFFENAASPNLAVSLPKEITPTQFEQFVEKMDSQHKGLQNAYKTLYTAGGADVTVVGANMQQMDFSAVQGKGETRIANAAGVPPTLLSFSEGMQGSSLNAGNYTAAKRNFVDTTMRDLWQNWCGSLQAMDAFAPPKPKSRLWYDGRDVPFLHEDAKDLADIQQLRASTINSYVQAGWTPDTSVSAVAQDDVMQLKHSGLMSVQLVPPGTQQPGSDPSADPTAKADDAADEYKAELDAARAEILGDDDSYVERREYYNIRVEKGKGGGRFRKLSEIIGGVLDDWLHGKGEQDDPLEFLPGTQTPISREQLRRVSKELGVEPRWGASPEEIKLGILKDARAKFRAGPALAGISREEQDAALKAMGVGAKNPVAKLTPIANRRTLTARDNAAALDVPGDSPRHMLSIDDPSPRPLPTPAVPVKKAAPAATGLAALGVVPVHISSRALGSPADDIRGLDSLTPSQRAEVLDGIDAYRGLGYKAINKYLRTGESARGTKAAVAGIDRAMDQSSLPEPIVVYRGVKTGESVFGPSAGWPDDLTGREWTDAGYPSTTASREIAESGGRVTMRVSVPAGTGAIKLSDFEQEVLLERGLTFRVVRDHGPDEFVDGFGRQHRADRLLDVEIVPKVRRDTVALPAPAKKAAPRKARPPLDAAAAIAGLHGQSTEDVRDALDLHTIPELKSMMPPGMAKTGKKRDLVDRLTEHLSTGAGTPDVPPAPNPDGLDGMDERRLRKLALDYDVADTGTEADLRARLRGVGAVSPEVRQQQMDAAPSVPAATGMPPPGSHPDEYTQARLAYLPRTAPTERGLTLHEAVAEDKALPGIGGSVFGTVPTGEAPASPERAREVEDAIRQAYADAVRERTWKSGATHWVTLLDIRDRLADRYPRSEVDNALQRMNRTPDAFLTTESNQKALSPAVRAAGVIIGNQGQQAISIKGDTRPPLPKADGGQGPSDVVARTAEVARLAAQGAPTETRHLGGGSGAELFTYADGAKLVKKNQSPRDNDAEQLGALVGDAVGILTPATHREGDRLYMEYMPGTVGTKVRRADRDAVFASPDGKLIGVTDMLLLNSDRHPGNWIQRDDGRVQGIDHGFSFEMKNTTSAYGSPFARQFFTTPEQFPVSIDVDPAVVAAMEPRLRALKPEFDRLGRGDWFDAMMTRFELIRAAAESRP